MFLLIPILGRRTDSGSNRNSNLCVDLKGRAGLRMTVGNGTPHSLAVQSLLQKYNSNRCSEEVKLTERIISSSLRFLLPASKGEAVMMSLIISVCACVYLSALIV